MRHLLPGFILENLQAGRYRGEFAAASLFIDLSGYTATTEALMLHGQAGAETIGELIRGLFHPLIQSVFDYHGFIAQSAGDAFTAIFPHPAHSSPCDTQQLALAAAIVIQHHFQTHAHQTTPFGDFTFAVKVGVGYGTVEWGILSSLDNTRHTYYVKGSAIQECTEAEQLAEGGEIILSPTVLAELSATEFTGDRLAGGFGRLRHLATIPQLPPAAASPTSPDLTLAATFFPPDLLTSPVSGEFRQVLSLFINLPGNPDHDELSAIMAVVFQLQEKYGGYLEGVDFGDKGCTMLLLWGAPISYENDLLRGINFALELRDTISLRAGITYRLARAGFLGAALWQSYTSYGRGVNLAARLMTAAAPGDIWLDEETARRVATQFAIQFHGHYQLKGFAEPQPAHRLLGRQAVSLSIPFYQQMLVGRETEIAQLSTFVEPIFRGQFAGFIMVIGEAGVGKSRLLHEFGQQLAGQHTPPPAIFLCQTDEIIRASLNPFRYWLRQTFAQVTTDPEAHNKTRFIARLENVMQATPDETLRQELSRTRSVLGALLDLRWPDSLYEQLEPKLRLENMFTALVALLRAESLRQPIIIQIEDVQWLDTESVQFLRRLSRAAQGYPIALLGSSREPVPADWLDAAAPQHTLTLNALPNSAIHALAQEITGANPAPDLITLLAERGQGNPFFIEQILRYGLEQGQLSQTPIGLTFTATEIGLPTDVRAILTARLDRLTQEVRQVVQTAAVLGREFEVQILTYMLKAEHFRLPADAFIREAERQAIWSLLAELRYLFKHALMRDTAYDMQLLSRRQLLHALALEAVETTYAADLSPHVAILAYHAEHSQNPEKQRIYDSLAGEAAAAAFQNQAAITYFTRVLPLLTEISAQVDIRLKLGAVWRRVGRWPEAGQVFQEALTLAEGAGDAAAMAQCQQQLGDLWRDRGHFDQALTWLQQALATWEQRGRDLELSQTLVEIGITYWRRGDYAAAQQTLERCFTLATAIDNWRTAALALNSLGNLAYAQGDLFAARTLYEESLEIRRAHNDDMGISGILNNLGVIASAEGDYARAWTLHQESLHIKRVKGDLRAVASSLTNLSVAAANQNDIPTAWQLCQESLDLRREMGDRQGMAMCLNNLGILALGQGDEASAQKYHEDSLALKQTIGDKPGIADSYLNLGLVAAHRGEYAAAADWYAQSQTLYQAVGEKRGITDIQHHLGMLALWQGDVAQAETLFLDCLATRQEMTNRSGTLATLIGLAAVWAERPTTGELSARLCGGVQAALAQADVWLDLLERRALARTMAQLGEKMGERGFAAAYQSGYALTLSETVALVTDQ